MIYGRSILKIAIFLALLISGAAAVGQSGDLVSYEGVLHIGKTESTIVYLGEESGDLAAFCFRNKSAVGRAILSKCRDGDRCQFTGRIDGGKDCTEIREYTRRRRLGDFSATGEIISLKSVKKLSGKK